MCSSILIVDISPDRVQYHLDTEIDMAGEELYAGCVARQYGSRQLGSNFLKHFERLDRTGFACRQVGEYRSPFVAGARPSSQRDDGAGKRTAPGPTEPGETVSGGTREVYRLHLL